MIPYVEVIGKYTLKSFAVVEPSQCWFELSYYDIGEFEVYAPVTPSNLQALKMGNYIKIPNKPYLWIIKSIQYTFNSEGAKMIDVKGFEAKWLLHTRCILNPYQLESNLATAVTNLLLNNMGANALSYRRIVGLNVITPTFNITIPDTQAPREDIADFLLPLLKANKCGCYVTFENSQITFRFIQGVNRTSSIIFSQSMDNLISSDYFENSENKKTFCRVVSTFSQDNGQGVSVDVEYAQDYNQGATNIDRLEMVVQSNISTKLFDENGNPVIDPQTGKQIDIDPSSTQYKSWQQEEGKNQLAEKYIDTEFNAELDLQYCNYQFEQDFFIGDLVKVMDEYFGYEATPRILKYTFKQDETGYGEFADYGNE